MQNVLATEETPFTVQEYVQARGYLMTGPRATPPRASTVRRMCRLVRESIAPTYKGALVRRGEDTYVHPTKIRPLWRIPKEDR